MKKTVFLLTLVLFFGVIAIAQAATVTASVTGDNWVWAWDGSSWITSGSNYWKWQNTDSFSGTISPGDPVDLYFAVMNEHRNDTIINPAGFLADINSVGEKFKETGTNQLYSDTLHWQVAVVPFATWPTTFPTPSENTSTPPPFAPTPTFDPTASGLTWMAPASYGSNVDNTNWWSKVNGVNNNAQWLWTNNNFNSDGQGQTNMDYLVVFHTNAAVVPEPTSMLLLGLGALGLFGLKKKHS